MGRVVALVDDLFFAARIRETARQVGVEFERVGTGDALMAAAQQNTASLFTVDLNSHAAPLAVVERLRAEGNVVPVVAFLSHVQAELAERARAAGCSQVLPRSKFTTELPAILSRAK